MNKKKHIKEIAQEIRNGLVKTNRGCVTERVAEHLHDQGYRRYSVGKWKNVKDEPLDKIYECSVCGFNVYGYRSNYCPNCGARMKGD